MDMLSTLTNTLSLGKRLKEISKNVSEAEFQNILAELLNQLSTANLEAASLKKQLFSLQEENELLKNQETDEKDKISKTIKLISCETVTIPPFLNDGENEYSKDLFSVFVNIQKDLVVGVTNKLGVEQRNLWIYHEVCPKLKINGLVELKSIPGVEYQRFTLSKKGETIIKAYDQQRHNKTNSYRDRNGHC